ncbi:cytochrome c3 family protein [Geomonas sp. Red32]|uniref:selenite/tellurite reduction operon c-type cytochrome ExtM n=1 Tax=Geomonas sp. Red32 TaxID=2912856 RepID=UPI00202CCA39|nr:selenite/tellurite reduction operon c-type cytochrome ExtM [Geomonas sp. Red32]MCM0082601.1 cytochrome c3 family protein [Geomonas sp. Red32]
MTRIPLPIPLDLILTAALGLIFLATLVLSGCTASGGGASGCESCHAGLEKASASHSGCVSCHGGDPTAATKEAAHRTMFGPGNPSAPEHWERSCGTCHRYQVGRVSSNLMYTASGMIRNIGLTWEGPSTPYGSRKAKLFDAEGHPLDLKPVAELDHISGDLYRKFCSRCHVAYPASGVYGASHASGCAACHFPYNDAGIYQGNDPSLRGKTHSASHTMERLPGTEVCTRCHNRSGRIALSFQGLYDGNNSFVPTSHGDPGPILMSGVRNAVHIAPDVHAAAGMECIDCHTSRDVMGDGYAYRNMNLQTEIACEDCHGGTRPPRYREILRENEEPLRESKGYRIPMRQGMKMMLTAKGRSYSNAFYADGTVYVLGKRSGKLFRSKVITGTAEHTVSGHARMECYACHSRTAVQCYGCHTKYDKSESGMDFIKGRRTPGSFSETEDYRMLYPFPLALNQRGRISPVTPGCQTFVTVVDPDGEVAKSEYVARFKGKHQLRFAPFYSHNTGKKAVACAECHGNPAFLGFGQHVVSGRNIEATLICERSDEKPLDGFLTMRNGMVRAYSAITREHSRPLDTAEVRRTLAVNSCLICHEKAADPIYRKKLDYRALDDPLHRRLLARP